MSGRVTNLVFPPGDQTPEGWLSQHDSSPTILPLWPESKRMALVCVMEGADETVAWVVTAQQQLHETLLKQDNLRRLFFLVPRSLLLRSPEICPGLTEASWT